MVQSILKLRAIPLMVFNPISSIPPDTPLYDHPLPELENWLRSRGCQQDAQELNLWTVEGSGWSAELELDIDRLTVSYLNVGGRTVRRSFKYSLSRQDVEDAIFGGP